MLSNRLHRRSLLHFRLFKKMYPQKLKPNLSYTLFLIGFYFYEFSFKEIIWYSIPIYIPNFTSKESLKDLEAEQKELVGNNKKIGFWFLMMLVWLFLIVIIYKEW